MTERSEWASSDGHPEPTGPFLVDMTQGGVFAQDMPAARPPAVKTHIKGLPGATGSDEGDQWKAVTP